LLRKTLACTALALSGCATTSAPSSELDQLKTELRAMRDDNARLQKRVDRLEAVQAVSTVRARPVAAAEPLEPTPSLQVIKLKPKADAAPKIDTSKRVVEPDPDLLEQVKSRAADAEPDGKDDPLAEQQYDAGVAALKIGNLEGGVDKLQRFAAENPRHARADNALFYAAVGLIGLSDYDDAARALQQLIEAYPAGDAVIDAMLKLGEVRLKLNQPKDAKAIYQKIVSNYPGTPAATAAQARLASL
jgi:tol-pal system protein YbgF